MSRIEIDVVRFQQLLKLFLKRLLSMMPFLVNNVSPYPLDLRFAHREGCEARLPAKSPRGLPLGPTG